MLILLHSVSQITKVILETSEHTKESYGHKACQSMHTCKFADLIATHKACGLSSCPTIKSWVLV